MSIMGRHLSWKAGKNDAKILVEALHCLVAKYDDVDKLEVTPYFKYRWEENNLWVMKTTLSNLSNLTEKQGQKLEAEQIRNAIHCLQALEFLEDKRGKTNSKTKTSSKDWCFVLKLNHQEKQENLYWLFGRKNEEGEWERRRVQNNQVLQPKSVKISSPNSIAIPEAEDSIEKRGNEIISDEKVSGITTLNACNYDPCFVGREGAIASLNTLVNEGKKVILIQAEGGVGKTTLARHYLETQGFDIVIEYAMAKECQNISSVESVVEEWLKRYFNEEPGREFGISLDRLRNKLEDKNKKIGILIDNLEPALRNGRFIENHRRYVELLRVLNHPNVQSLTLITSREPIYEEGISVCLCPLEGLSKEAWNQFFESCRINTGSSPLDEKSALSLMHKAYGGNAEAMFIFSGAIKIECQGDLEAYWQKNHDDLLINPTLENLIEGQFNKLQHDNPKAYRLLCRLGCYRYQDVPLVPEEGIYYLLWDVREEQRKRVIKALRDRSLIKCLNQEFYLHPVIKAEAIDRLRGSKDWEITNRKIAEFWTDSVDAIETIKNALKAFEAYQHYLSIGDFESCGIVCEKERKNKWVDKESLGASFYKLGLLHPMIDAINRIKGNINSKYILSRIHNILGDLYWQAGYLQLAIKSHELSETISNEALECSKLENENIIFKLKKLKVNSFLNRGLCHLDLWNLEEAIDFFTKAKVIAEDINLGYIHYFVVDCHYCLSFVNSCLGFSEKAFYFANLAINLENNFKLKSTRLTIWSGGYSLLFLAMTYKNLGETEKSFEKYREAKLFAENTNYTQLKAKSLTGLAELYREQKEFDTALQHHLESIELLNKLRAQCDLAEAYYQQALTYKMIGNKQKSKVDFNKAIQLFEEIEAPNQVEKVRQAM